MPTKKKKKSEIEKVPEGILSDPQCIRCALYAGRQHVVAGTGNVHPELMIVGEAPGKLEDQSGVPFVGFMGKTLDALLSKIGLQRSDVYLTNVVKCRPVAPRKSKKDNRAPNKKEQDACRGYLMNEITAVLPKAIISAGDVATKAVLGKIGTLKDLRGTINKMPGKEIMVIPTYHPSKVCSNPNLMTVTEEDFRRALDVARKKIDIGVDQHSYNFIDTEEKLEQFLTLLESISEIAVDVETNSTEFLVAKISCIGFSWAERHAATLPFLLPSGESFWSLGVEEKILAVLKRIFENPQVKKILHNAGFDCKVIKKNWDIEINNVFDTMLAFHLIEEDGSYGLKSLAWRFTTLGGYERPLNAYIDEHLSDGVDYSKIPYALMAPYNSGDADCTFRLFKKFDPVLDEMGSRKLFEKIVTPLEKVLRVVEYEGVCVDREEIARAKVKYEALIKEREAAVKTLAGYEFNLNSSQQIGDLLFKKLKLSPSKVTPTGANSTDEDVLVELAKVHPIPKAILDYREIHKLYSTYIIGTEESTDHDNRIHTRYHINGTVTGRLSSSKPNLQNIPKGTNDIKSFFIADPGTTFVQFDFKQAEYRVWAHLSNDQTMIADIKNGLDIHKKTASVLYKVKEELVTKEQRDLAKSCVFGLMYGLTAEGLAYQKGIEVSEALAVVNFFFGRYPRAYEWLSHIQAFARQNKYVDNMFGRRRHLAGVDSDDKKVKEEAYRQAMNSPIQGAASDLTNFASIRVYNYVPHEDVKLRLNVHDSLTFAIIDGKLDHYIRICKQIVEQGIGSMEVPMITDVQVGKSWGSLKPYEIA